MGTVTTAVFFHEIANIKLLYEHMDPNELGSGPRHILQKRGGQGPPLTRSRRKPTRRSSSDSRKLREQVQIYSLETWLEHAEDLEDLVGPKLVLFRVETSIGYFAELQAYPSKCPENELNERSPLHASCFQRHNKKS